MDCATAGSLTDVVADDTVASMDDSGETQSQGAVSACRWLLFIHQLPPKPDYLRVKVRRRLRGLGAAAVKHTVYALPNTEECLEDFEWLRGEIEAAGGSAVIAEAAFVAGLTDEELSAMLESEAGTAAATESNDAREVDRVEPGRRWVTREGVGVDRIASAWLIRKFIDPAASFSFVRPRGHMRHPDELRFDMFEAEYTHVGEDCTFQTLTKRFNLGDSTLRVIGEIVRDIDCKDERFGRPETAGVATIIHGITDAHDDDTARLGRGGAVFDDLYASLRKRRSRRSRPDVAWPAGGGRPG